MVGVSEDQSEYLCRRERLARPVRAHHQELGAYDAMNLDGGASTGLWVNGKYLVSPGRQINNALLLTR